MEPQKEQERDRRERAELAGRIRDLNVAFETTQLSELLNPLLSIELTIQQLKILTVLVSAPGGATGRGLSETFGVSMASMSGVLDRLVAQGMVARSEDPQDARVRRIHATEFGRTSMRRLIASRPEFEDDILVALEREDLESLLRGMTAVQNELKRRAGR